MLKLTRQLTKNQTGFSLTELMVTISIIGTVGTISAPKLNQSLAAARDANRKMNIRQVQTALNLYYDDNLSYPKYQGESSGNSYKNLENFLVNSNNQYLSELPVDPLGKDKYVYKYWSNGQKFEITYELEDETITEPQKAVGM
ncbi:MAG: type II secretion system protein GspG [bacterium]